MRLPFLAFGVCFLLAEPVALLDSVRLCLGVDTQPVAVFILPISLQSPGRDVDGEVLKPSAGAG